MSTRLLLVEDDTELGGQIVQRLRDAGFDPVWWKEGRPLLAGALPDVELVVLDLMLPGRYGMDMLRISAPAPTCRCSCSARATTPPTKCARSSSAPMTT